MIPNLLDPDFKTPSRSPSYATPPSSNTRLKSRVEHDTPTRVRIKTKFEDGLSRAQIRRQIGIPERSQRYITSTIIDRRPGRFRPGP